MRRFLVTFAALLVFVMVAVVHAQGPVGTLNGTVTDPAGAKVRDHVQLERLRAGIEQAIEKFLEVKAA